MTQTLVTMERGTAMAPVTMGKLLKFPELESNVTRNCACCGRDMDIPVDLEKRWGAEEYLCFMCFLWLKSYEQPEEYAKFMERMDS